MWIQSCELCEIFLGNFIIVFATLVRTAVHLNEPQDYFLYRLVGFFFGGMLFCLYFYMTVENTWHDPDWTCFPWADSPLEHPEHVHSKMYHSSDALLLWGFCFTAPKINKKVWLLCVVTLGQSDDLYLFTWWFLASVSIWLCETEHLHSLQNMSEKGERWLIARQYRIILQCFLGPDWRLTIRDSTDWGSLITGFHESKVINYESVDSSSP